LLLVVGIAVCTTPNALAQVASGTFTGSVTDPTGAVIPNASVTATNEGTSVPVSTKTNTDGLYTIPSLPPGFYTLKAEASGFRVLVNQHIELTVGYTQRVDFKLEVGQTTQVVEVQSQAPLVSTEDVRMSELITARQVQNLPLNGRNVFQMIQLAPGAVNVSNLITEPGSHGNTFQTVVNGARVNMNGYLLDGISDKGLSGGSNTQPSPDTVQEFRVDTENISAEYGSTVGAMTTVVTKSGSNSLHGSAYEYLRNDALDAREFFDPAKIPPFRMNQFGATAGGPVKKDKIFFFGSYEGERTRAPISENLLIETPQFQNLVESAAPNSVAALLYKNFPGPMPANPDSLATYITSDSGQCASFDPVNKLSDAQSCLSGTYGIDPNSTFGKALLANPNLPTFGAVNGTASLFTKNQFYDGNQWSARLDFEGEKNKVFGRFFMDKLADPHYTPATNGGSPSAFDAVRGFQSPNSQDYPQFALGYTRTFSPTVLNEFRAGWARANTGDIATNNPGVPQISFGTGEVNFGGYNGYPQLFHEEQFQFSDMVTISHGKHSLKFGGDFVRNYENSEFNVGRPSIYFVDSIYFVAGQVGSQANGVDPGAIDPTTGKSTGQAHLASNIRAWRNINFGAFVQDDWRVTPRLTLNLGLRYDLFTRHSEKYGQVTEFILPSNGANETERLRNINCYVDISGATGGDGQPCDGGFAKNNGSLATGDHNNFGPRFGFAYDVRGDGKTAIRGAFGVSYNGEVYNPLSNSRWNPPFYSFNLAACSDGTNKIGPQYSDSCVFGPVDGSAPTYTGPPSNAGGGPAGASFGAFAGNIQGWNPWNSNAAFLTGIVLPNFRDPYVYGAHLSVEHQFAGGLVLKTSWVGTFGHKLYRAEDINRQFGGRDLKNASNNNSACSPARLDRVNCLYARLRVWENSVNSNYDALQIVAEKRMTRGVEFHANYVWSHSLDTRSTWHSGATTSNGAAEGFSMDQARPGLDYGSSIFDSRHRVTASAVWLMPWFSSQQGFIGHALGGWQLNGIFSYHTGFPWTPFCTGSSSPGGKTACDFDGDAVRNDRPNAPAFGNTLPSTDRAVFEPGHSSNLNVNDFYDPHAALTGGVCPSPVPGCSNYTGRYDGSLGRNTFRGPDFQEFDFSLVKNIKTSERTKLIFRAEAFNLFNRTNLQMPSATIGASRSQFGLSTAAYAARQIQFALRFEF
jgi:hypothetical protein